MCNISVDPMFELELTPALHILGTLPRHTILTQSVQIAHILSHSATTPVECNTSSACQGSHQRKLGGPAPPNPFLLLFWVLGHLGYIGACGNWVEWAHMFQAI